MQVIGLKLRLLFFIGLFNFMFHKQKDVLVIIFYGQYGMIQTYLR